MAAELNTIIGRTLLGAGGMSMEFLRGLRDRLIDAKEQHHWPHEMLAIARSELQQFEPLLADHLADSALSAWIYGFDDVANRFPEWLQREFRDTIRRGPPNDPPALNLFGMFGEQPRLRLPIIENAAKSLFERRIMTKDTFDAASDLAKRKAFEIAGGLEADTIDRIRGFLATDLADGTSLASFKNRVEEHLGTSPIAPGHLENVYRTNIQAAIRDGRETLASDPVVAATFPYKQYLAVHDARARPTHQALEKLGLNGTGIYRADDPFWDHFSPPWHYQCRCSTRLLTIDQAARAGVKEAQEWLRTGRPPLQPEYRYSQIPFPSNPDWGHRGNVGIAV